MSSLFLNWPKGLLLFALVFFGCSGSQEDWPISEAADEGGFTVRMPLHSRIDRGGLMLGNDTLVSHINIVADSGINYVSSWITVPDRWRPLPENQMLDSLWPFFVDRSVKTRIDEVGPLQTERPGERGAWFVNEKDVRLGIVVRIMDDRAVLMAAGTPEFHFGIRQRRNMIRFLNSFEAIEGH